MIIDKGIASRRMSRGSQSSDDRVAVEEPLEIRVAQDTIAITMRTPGNDVRLALGFLLAEGIIKSAADVGTAAYCGRPGEEGWGNIIEVTPASGAQLHVERLDASRRGTLTTSACGVCGRRSVAALGLARKRPAPGCGGRRQAEGTNAPMPTPISRTTAGSYHHR